MRALLSSRRNNWHSFLPHLSWLAKRKGLAQVVKCSRLRANRRDCAIEAGREIAGIRVFEFQDSVHIRCSRSDLLPVSEIGGGLDAITKTGLPSSKEPRVIAEKLNRCNSRWKHSQGAENRR